MPTLDSRHRIEGLQALRGIAAAAVYIQHVFAFSNAISPGPVHLLYRFGLGGLGVFIFFGLSAYLMAAKATDPPLKFAVDRLRRIYPTFWIAVAVASAISFVLIGVTGVTWQLLLLVPFGDEPAVRIPYWTLYYEMAFYFFMFVSIGLLGRRAIHFVLPALAASFLFSSRHYVPEFMFPGLRELFLNVYSLYFLAGLLAWYLPRPNSRFSVIYALIGLLFFYYFTFVPGGAALAGSVGITQTEAEIPFMAVAVFCFVRAGLGWRANGLIGRFFRRIGDLSYGIYLIHLVPFTWMVTVAVHFEWRPNYFVAACLMFVLGLPISYAMGWIDIAVQRRLRGLSAPFARRPAVADAPEASPAE